MESNIDTNDGNAPALFPNLEKTMHSDLFLPLDNYMDNTQYMNPDNWNQKIMDAGKTAEGPGADAGIPEVSGGGV